MLRVILFCISFTLIACSSLQDQASTGKGQLIALEFSEPTRIRFQGKGAGAGIALMSTMGPVGIALGVAIDEGIAKDIRKAMGKEKGDVLHYLKDQVSRSLVKQGYSVSTAEQLSIGKALKEASFPKLVIRRVGFKITNGSTDATAAEWELELHNGPDEKHTVNYPKDFDKDKVDTQVLADLKTNGKLGIELLDESLEKAMDRVLLKARSQN